MTSKHALKLDPDRLFPDSPRARQIARGLYTQIKDLPIISPHGHTDPEWFATNAPFEDATSLLLAPDHYLYRMLYSQGIDLDRLCVPAQGVEPKSDRRDAWRLFATNFHLFRGTPSWLWLNHVFLEVFDFDERLTSDTADHYYDVIGEALASDAFRPRALFERFNIEVLATTEGAEDRLLHHKAIQNSGWKGRARMSKVGAAIWRRTASGGLTSEQWERQLRITATQRRRRRTCLRPGLQNSIPRY